MNITAIITGKSNARALQKVLHSLDFQYDRAAQLWVKGCQCGNEAQEIAQHLERYPGISFWIIPASRK